MSLLILFLSSVFINCGHIDSNSLDNIRVGMTIDEFLDLDCKPFILKKELINLEGDDYDIYNAYLNDSIAYAVEPVCEDLCKIWRIWVYSSNYKTDEGIGVGSTLGELKKKYTIKDFVTAEGSVSILVNEIDIGFLLDSKNIPFSWWTNQSLEGLDEKLIIDIIII